MPGGKTHMAIGVGVGLALGGALPLSISFPWQLGLTVGLATIGALAPDLDIADNELEELGRSEGRQAARRVRRVGRRAGLFWRAVTWIAGSVIWLVGELVSRVIEAIAALIQSVTTHRGMTHSLLGAAVVTLVSIALSVLVTSTRNPWWGLAWSAGWASHLAADALTLSGLKLLQPWSERRYWLAPPLLRFRVGSWPDALLGAVAPVLGLLALLLFQGLLGALTGALSG